MEANKIRDKFLQYYKERGHVIIPSSSLLPEKDSSLLFTNSGMFPLVPYLLGEKHPEGKRLANSQKCFRSDDIEEVGNKRHNTFFEMLGNWSLGDYFKEEQLPWVFNFITEELGIDCERIYVSVYRGNKGIGIEKDKEAVEIWKKIFKEKGISAEAVDLSEDKGMQGGRIFYYPDSENWWSRVGGPENMPEGEPGGPDSEIFYDMGEELKLHEESIYRDKPCHVACDCGRFLEIGNSVFMEFIKTKEGFAKLSQKNVDFGGGLERLAMVTQGKSSVFETDLFFPIIKKIEELSGTKYEDNLRSYRIIADHIKATTFIIGDERGVAPSNKQQGYFVRRLIRRSVREGMRVGIKEKAWLGTLVGEVIEIYKEAYPELKKNASFVYSEVKKEEEAFQKTIGRGLKEWDKLSKESVITGEQLAKLYQTYGFPVELTEELAKERGQEIDKEGFKEEMKKHQDLSRELSAGVFKSGLSDNEEKTVRYHTATHLLLSALRKVLGEEVEQKGSNITSERLRFDFSFERKMSEEEKKEVERLVNEMIEKDLKTEKVEMETEKALSSGVVASFAQKYPSRVLVYSFTDKEGNTYSKEICSGPHVERTGDMGIFRVKKEEASSSGVRRIKAILE